MSDIKIKVGLDMNQQDVTNALKEIDKLKKSLEMSMDISNEKQVKQALLDLNKLANSLEGSMNKTFGKVNVQQFERNLKQANVSMGSLTRSIERAGEETDDLFNSFKYGAEVITSSVKRQQTMIDKLSDTMVKTASWSLANRAFDVVANSVSQAAGYMKSLDESLTNISIVSEMSKNELKDFAKYATEASKALGQTTVAYTEGALLYLQQGKTLAEAQELTRATLVGANITGESTADVAELLTASLNGYNLAAKDAMDITDKFAAVGAATGSDFNELATAFSKTASMASVAGISFDQLAAQIATISTVTREAPESIGTSLKTIFGRMTEIKELGSDEEGTTYGSVEETLGRVGIAIADENDKLRDMGEVVEEVGNSWEMFDRNTQLAIANVMAGSRQANRLIALFENWGMYQDSLTVSIESSGSALEQQEEYLDSNEAKTNSLRAAMENLFNEILDEDAYKGVLDSLTNIVDKITVLIDSLGGVSGILTTLTPLWTNLSSKFLINVGKDSLIKTLTGDPFKGFKASFSEINTIMAQTPEKAKFAMEKLGIPADVIQEHEILIQKKGVLEDEMNKAKVAIDNERLAFESNQEALKKADQQYMKSVSVYNEIQKEIKETEIAIESLNKVANKDISGKVSTHAKQKQEMQEAREELVKYEQKLKEQNLTLSEADTKMREMSRAYAEVALDSYQMGTSIERNQSVLRATASEFMAADQQANKFANTLNKVAKLQSLAKYASLAVGIGSSLISAAKAMQTFGDAAATTEDKMNALTSVTTSLGMSMMMIPNPIFQVIGAITMLAGPVIDLLENKFNKLKQLTKDNEAVTSRYTEKISELSDEISNLESQSSRLVEAQNNIVEAGGDVNNLTYEQKEAYKELANEIANTTPEMVAYYDAEGNAILKANKNLDEYIAKKKESIELEQSLMVGNRDKFVEQYAIQSTQGETQLAEAQRQLEIAKADLEAMDAKWFTSRKAIQNKEEDIAKLETKIANLTSDLTNLDANIQNNIIKPFLMSNEAINSTEDSLKQIIATNYDIEKISPLMTKYTTSWQMVNGELKEVKRSGEEMASLIKEELDAIEEKAINTAKALSSIRSKGIGGSDLNKEYAQIYGNLQNVDQVTQDYIGTMAQFGSTAEETEVILTNLGKTIDEFGVAKSFNIEQILPIASAETEKNLEKVNKEIEVSKKRIEELKIASEGMSKYTTYYDTGEEVKVVSEEYRPILQEISSLQESILQNEYEKTGLIEKQSQIYQQLKEDQIAANEAYGTYLLNLAQTTDGMNQIVDSYNAQYEKFSELNELMNKQSSQTISTPGALGEEATTMEVETFEDSDLGVYFNDFSNYLSKLVDSDFTSLMDTFEELRYMGADAAMDMTDRFEDMGKTLQGLPDGILEEFANMSEQMSGYVADIQQNGEFASLDAIGAVSSAVQQQQQELGQMYAAINKDSVAYFQEFKQQNQDQINTVGIATGIMGNEYATYAEYKASLDQWMADNSAWLADEEISSAYWAAMEGINAKAQEEKAYAILSGDMNAVAEADSKARAAAAEAASWASALAEAKAGRERATILKESLQSVDLSSLDPELSAAAGEVIQRRLAEAEADLGVYNEMISILQAKLDAASAQGGGGGGAKGFGGFNFSAGGGSASKKPNTPAPSKPTITPSAAPSKDSSSSSTTKDVDDLEYIEDLYHDINMEIKKVINSMQKLGEVEDDLYGQAKLQNMAQQTELMRRQKDLAAQRLEIAKKDAAQQRANLASQGVTFDENGTITNYNEIIKQKTNWANSLTGDAKKEAQQYVKDLQSAINSYETLQFTTILNYESELEELREAIQDKILEAINYEYQINIEASVIFQEDADFFNEFLEGYEEVDERFGRILETFNSQVDALQAFDKRYKDIVENDELDAEAKREALEELKKDFKDALLTLQEFYEAISDYIQDVIEQNTKAVYNQIDAFKKVNSEISDMIDMYELLGNKDFDEINRMLQVSIDSNRAQVDLLNKARKEAVALRDSLEEGTDEWIAANEQVEKMDEDIRKLANETIKLLQEQLQNTFDKTLSEVEKALTGGLGFDKLEKEIEKARKEQEKYYDSVEKSVWSARMLEKIQNDINKQTDPKKKEQLQKFYDEEISSLLQKDKLTADEVKRAELLYDITLKQMAVEEARANKTIMRLVRDDQGNWVYQYMTDLDAVAQAQDNLTQGIDELLAHDKEVYEKTQDEILERRKQFVSDMQALQEAYLNGEFASEAEFNQALAQLQEEFNLDMKLLTEEYALAERNIADSTLMSICDAYKISYGTLDAMTEEQKLMFENMGIQLGNSWDETLKNMTESNRTHTDDFIDAFNNPESGITATIDRAFDEMEQAASDYQDKVSQVQEETGMSFDAMKEKTDELKGEIGKLNESAQTTIDKMGLEYDAIQKLLPEYNKIKTAYDKIRDSVKDYITELNNAIQKQKELANTPTPTPSNPSSSSGSSSNTTTSTSTPKTPGVGDTISSVPGTWFYDSYGAKPTGNPYNWAKQFKITSHKTDGRAKPWHVQGTNGGTGSGWVEWVGFKTGGYTGDWAKTGGLDGEGGKAALLHQKEMVLNASDTENMLKAVELVRGITQNLGTSLGNITNSLSGDTIQNITIQADFSGVKNSNEIEQAFDNLVNRAWQYANKN